MIKKAQVFLETTIAFILITGLFLGIIGIWVWGDKQIAGRQPPYTGSRIQAGRPGRNPGGEADREALFPVYTPEELEGGQVHYF